MKAKGKAKQKDTLVRTEMEDGSVEEHHEYEKKTKVKKFFCKWRYFLDWTALANQKAFLKQLFHCRQARDGGRHRGADRDRRELEQAQRSRHGVEVAVLRGLDRRLHQARADRLGHAGRPPDALAADRIRCRPPALA